MALSFLVNKTLLIIFAVNSSGVSLFMTEPQSLLKSCLKSVYKYRSVLKQKWNIFPRNLRTQLRVMCELSENTDDDNADKDAIETLTITMLMKML